MHSLALFAFICFAVIALALPRQGETNAVLLARGGTPLKPRRLFDASRTESELNPLQSCERVDVLTRIISRAS